MYVYQSFEDGLWTVGFYDGNGKWQSESDHKSPELAIDRMLILNGSKKLKVEPLILTAIIDISNELKTLNPDLEWIKIKLKNLISFIS